VTVTTPANCSWTARSDADWVTVTGGGVERLPFSIKIMLESALRNCDGYVVAEEDVKTLANYNAKASAPVEIPFKLTRVVMQDFTGVPAVVDLAAMRAAAKNGTARHFCRILD